MLPILRTVNKNPNIAVFSCCSGHDGHPYLWVYFKTSQIRQYYISQLLQAGYKVDQIQPADGDYIEIPRTSTARAIREGENARIASQSEINRFWSTVIGILIS